jgi:hypothetical protein
MRQTTNQEMETMGASIQYRAIKRAVKKNNLKLGHMIYLSRQNEVCAAGGLAVALLGLEKAKMVLYDVSAYIAPEILRLDGNMYRAALASVTGLDVRKIEAMEHGYERGETAPLRFKTGKYKRFYNVGKRLRDDSLATLTA